METPARSAVILEPEVLQRSVIARVLERERVRVVVCQSPDDLGPLLAEHRPDLLLLDAHLPQVNGLDLVAQLRRQDALGKTRVMVISSLAFPEVVVRAAAYRVDDFVVKPVQVDDFLARVRRLLEAAQTAEKQSIG